MGLRGDLESSSTASFACKGVEKAWEWSERDLCPAAPSQIAGGIHPWPQDLQTCHIWSTHDVAAVQNIQGGQAANAIVPVEGNCPREVLF